ncbi:MAG: GNAT family N-acetyltransferase [Parafilimonas sp.]
MQIVTTTLNDIDSVKEIYSAARHYQLQQTGYGWPVFADDFIEQEIKEKRHFKVLDDAGEIAGIFSVVNEEPVIWDDTDGKEAIYLHRMAVSSRHRGKQIAAEMVNWAKKRAIEQNKKFVRIDTWSDNEALKSYYRHLGFALVGKKSISSDTGLPEHYNNIEVNLFEIKLKVL